MKRFNYKWLLLILMCALGMRVYQFGRIPDGVNRDEAALGYTAKLLMETGKDEHGKPWPLKFESFGDWKQPAYIYLSIPAIWLFGLSPVTVRLISLIAGVGMIVAAYFIVLQITAVYPSHYRYMAAGAGALFITFNPWHFHFSHLALEAMVAASIAAFAALLLLKQKQLWKGFGVGLLLLSLFTYHAAIIIIPLWFIGYVCLNPDVWHQKQFALVSVIFFIIILAFSLQSVCSSEMSKVSGTTIFSMSSTEQWQSIYQFRSANFISKLVHNQYVYFGKTIIKNYFRAFSPEFLFTRGGAHPHYNVPGFGNFFVVEIFLCAMGIWWILKTKNKEGMFFVLLLLLAPIPAAITKDGIHSTRNIFMLPSVQILAACGVLWPMLKIKKIAVIKLFVTAVGAGLLFQAIPFYANYWTDYPDKSHQIFSGYMKDISIYLAQQRPKYHKIYLTFPYESPYIFYAFYNQLDTHIFLNSVSYYPIDTLGFRYAEKLLNMEYVPNIKDIRKRNAQELNNTLILSRVEEISGITPLAIWTDKTGTPQIGAWKGEQLTVRAAQ